MPKTPVLFIIFNRPDTTKAVFNEIKKYKPNKLYIAADGPRKNKPGDIDNCDNSREVVKNIGWNCKIKRLYRDNNLGCKKAVSSAIDWFFKNEKEGIILEDDCLPNKSFFKFCETMLQKYRNDEHIFHIGANNFQPKIKQNPNTYYFTKYPHIWGWASWRRAWKFYDVNMKTWPKIKRNNSINKYWENIQEKLYWQTIFDATYSGKIDTWDYQWLYTTWLNGGISIGPGANLVTNIGFNKNSTHTTLRSKILEVKPKEMKFPLKDPKNMIANKTFDTFSSKYIYHADLLTITALKVKYLLEIFINEK